MVESSSHDGCTYLAEQSEARACLLRKQLASCVKGRLDRTVCLGRTRRPGKGRGSKVETQEMRAIPKEEWTAVVEDWSGRVQGEGRRKKE